MTSAFVRFKESELNFLLTRFPKLSRSQIEEAYIEQAADKGESHWSRLLIRCEQLVGGVERAALAAKVATASSASANATTTTVPSNSTASKDKKRKIEEDDDNNNSQHDVMSATAATSSTTTATTTAAPTSTSSSSSTTTTTTAGGLMSPIPPSIEQPTKKANQGRRLIEVAGDLFDQKSANLAHCISADARLGKGIAKEFVKRVPGLREQIVEQGKGVGDVAAVIHGSNYVYNLITKNVYSEKPTYETLTASLRALLKHATDNHVTAIAMPRIGCGLDGLSWPTVRRIIDEVFENSNVQITVYNK